MDMLKAVSAKLDAMRQADFPDLAKATGVSEGAIRKIRYGVNRDPRISTVQALFDYFENLHKPAAKRPQTSKGKPA